MSFEYTFRNIMCLICVSALTGCAKPKMDMAEMMKQPPRPAELDRLEMWVGTWNGEAKVKMPGSDETHISSGRNTSRWATPDKWVLVEEWEHQMGKDNLMKGANLFWWDAPSKQYQMSSADNYGGSGQGWMTYDAETKTWHIKSESRDGRSGQESVGEGTVKMTGPNSMDWQFTEWDSWKLVKIFELTGSSHRQ